MSFEPARPRYTLPFAGQDYDLLGSFGMIEAVEFALKGHIGQITVQIVRGMTCSDLAKLIATLLTACGHKTTTNKVWEDIWMHVGLTGDENEILRLHLYAFLSICLAPPGQREKTAKDMGEIMGKPTAPAASPGHSTAASA